MLCHLDLLSNYISQIKDFKIRFLIATKISNYKLKLIYIRLNKNLLMFVILSTINYIFNAFSYSEL